MLSKHVWINSHSAFVNDISEREISVCSILQYTSCSPARNKGIVGKNTGGEVCIIYSSL